MSAAEIGNDLLDGRITGFAKDDDPRIEAFAGRYAATPVWDVIPRGWVAHIGGGIFLHRCRECDDYVRSYGAVLFIRALDIHQREAHGIEQGPLLPPAPVGVGENS